MAARADEYGPRLVGFRRADPAAGAEAEAIYQVGVPLRTELYYGTMRVDHVEWRRGGTRGVLLYSARTTGEARPGERAAPFRRGPDLFRCLKLLSQNEQSHVTYRKTSETHYPSACLRIGGWAVGPLHCADGPAEVFGSGREAWLLWGEAMSPSFVMSRAKTARQVAWEGPADYDIRSKDEEAAQELVVVLSRRTSDELRDAFGDAPSTGLGEWYAASLERLYQLRRASF